MKSSIASGCMPLFRFAGIQVFLHWSWFFAAAVMVEMRSGGGFTNSMALLTVLSLFGIVLLHEFGHALACRSVGGHANTIILWPLGGVAFVKPPPRPGPVLWSIAAGPLVNVVLVPVTIAVWYWSGAPSLAVALSALHQLPPAQQYAVSLALMNVMLLIFNMLPVYPLDGGQVVQAILWFFVGRATSLKIVAWLGLIAAAVGGLFALWSGRYWLMVMAGFLVWQAFNGLRTARVLALIEKHEGHVAWRSPVEIHQRPDSPPRESV